MAKYLQECAIPAYRVFKADEMQALLEELHTAEVELENLRVQRRFAKTRMKAARELYLRDRRYEHAYKAALLHLIVLTQNCATRSACISSTREILASQMNITSPGAVPGIIREE